MMQEENEALRPGVFPLGARGLIAFLAFLSAFVPLSIDLYLPAMPKMVGFFSTTPELTNFTLSFFMLFFAISMLLWGPFTDKYGRKPILYLGLSLYITGSLVCVFSTSIYLLITGRVIQAIGSGAIQAVSMAIVKDNFKGLVMEKVLVWIQTLTILCPMLAPVIGAFLLKFVSWRGLFVVLAFCGILAFTISLFLKETLENPTAGSAFQSLGRIGFVLRNRGYLVLLVIFSLMVMPVMSFLSTSSFIYMNLFNLSAEKYSYFFAFNGCFAMLAPHSLHASSSQTATSTFPDGLFRLCCRLRLPDPDIRCHQSFCLRPALCPCHLLRQRMQTGRHHADHEPDGHGQRNGRLSLGMCCPALRQFFHDVVFPELAGSDDGGRNHQSVCGNIVRHHLAGGCFAENV